MGWLRRHADVLFFGAFLSAFAWCIVWIMGYVALTIVFTKLQYPTNTTAFIITITVLLGHLPKFVAMILGTDTDFQDLRESLSNQSFANLPYARMAWACSFIGLLVWYAMPNHMQNLEQAIDPLNIQGFVSITWQNKLICFLLFCIQAVFSYPNSVRDVGPNEKKLPGAA